MKILVILSQFLLASLLAFNCSGNEFHASGNERLFLPSGEVHDGWYFAGRAQVDIDGTVNGDAFVAGGVVNVRGTINGMLVVAGGEVNVTGTVTDRIICVGGNLRIFGKTGKSLYAGGGTIVLEQGATVGEYMMAGGGQVQIFGSVGRDAKIGATDLRLTGTIKGDLEAGVERFATDEGSSVGGNLTVVAKDSGNIRITPGTVLGKVTLKAGKEPPAPRTLGMKTGKFVFYVLLILSLCLTALVLSFLLPRQLVSVGTTLNERPGESVLGGLAALILVPVGAVILCCTVIGIPIGLFLLFVLGWLAYLSQMVVGVFLALRVFGLEGRKGWALFGPVALGVLAVGICMLIPVVNVI
ncbi:MAG TPA: hypothetical protein VMF59_05710, partial [Bacteroidota bacterium]|nr:hypothetical protein [Bacteroidota bacterium]